MFTMEVDWMNLSVKPKVVSLTLNKGWNHIGSSKWCKVQQPFTLTENPFGNNFPLLICSSFND